MQQSYLEVQVDDVVGVDVVTPSRTCFMKMQQSYLEVQVDDVVGVDVVNSL